MNSFWIRLIILKSIVASPIFRLYNTDAINHDESHYVCLNYYVLDNIIVNDQPSTKDQQIIPYCIRPLHKLIWRDDLSVFGVRLTFEMLNNLNVNSQNLLEWSAPIDVVERYELYLSNKTISRSKQEFYNCSYGWFGSTCEYTFFSDNSFSEIVHDVFVNKLINIPIDLPSISNYTCYEHLNCKRGPKPICLDWREVCNGYIDCVGNGIDEQECFSLEENECIDGEYRCRNGQCIPESFLHDNELNPDCLDKSDEKLSISYSHRCISDPSFRCEETICTYAFDIVCGDGQCLSNSWQWSKFTTCNNRRNYLIDQAKLAYSENLHLSYICWSSMVCLLDLTYYFQDVDCEVVCKYSLSLCINLIREYCPREFLFPSYPMIAGHVYFAYKNDQSINSKNDYKIPDYLCYDEYLCPFLASSIIIENRTCRFYEDLNIYSFVDSHNIFQSCLTNPKSKNKMNCEDSNLYECLGSYKCISKYRLVDGVYDCFENDDENFNNSCSLNHKHRFQCSSQLKKCISPINIYDQFYNCPNYEDENNIFTAIDNGKVPFPMMCDGFFDMIILFSNENNETDETDETHCEYWPCINQYTRCDGIWNCANGGDELNCGPSLCPSNEHPCVSPITYNMTCLSYNRSGDGKIDCLGATDEQQHCRKSIDYSRHDRFQCLNTDACIGFQYLCDGDAVCPLEDDEQFCRNHTFHQIFDICNNIWKEYRTTTEQFFCEKSIIKSPIVYFKLKNSTVHSKTTISSTSNQISSSPDHLITKRNIDYDEHNSWLCNRGIRMYRGKEEEEICLCPPSYYGSRCEYQNERVSISMQIRTGETRIVYEFLFILIDNTGQIHSIEQRNFLSMRDCRAKFNLNLLYRNRPKELNGKNYSVRIDMFDKLSLKYRSSWLFPLQFLFLPVQRLAIQLIIRENDFESIDNCPLQCDHGKCMKYVNKMEYFCHCNQNWSDLLCSTEHECNCALDSLCVNFVNNRSICVCPINKFGPQCRLNHLPCKNNPCMNGGTCIPTDERIEEKNFTCICDAKHSGPRCERTDSIIAISFSKDMPIPSSILVHFITVLTDAHPLQTTSIAKIGFDRDTAILYRSDPFHIVIVQISTSYYLTIVQNDFNSSVDITTSVIPSRRCASINELFNRSILEFQSLRRVKYYHLPCQERSELMCFYDDIYICLCNSERHANCFEFNHNIEYNCQGLIYCANNASCFQNHPACPNTIICSCPECFYGTRCEFSTHTFVLSLDVILSYHIHPDISFTRQPSAVKVSATLTMILTIIGIISNILSIITFKVKSIKKTGCGLYLYICSINSLLIMIILTFKFWLLVISQMNLISNRTMLSINCIIMEFLLKGFFSISDWLSSCVSIERVFSAIKGVKFDKNKSKRCAKYVIVIIYIVVLSSFIHDPIHRDLIDDIEEKRSWCVVKYSSSLSLFNSIINIFHVGIPFTINFLSGFIIIIAVTRQRSIAQKKKNYKEHLIEQLRHHKHLILTPFILVILVLPRLIISFVSGCMKSAREPWLFLIGYFISFIPPVLTFFVFVLPSEVFTKEFVSAIKTKCININRRRI